MTTQGGVDWRDVDEISDSKTDPSRPGAEIVRRLMGVDQVPANFTSETTSLVLPIVYEDAIQAKLNRLATTSKIWFPFKRSSALWGFFCLNDTSHKIDVHATQELRCWICHPNKWVKGKSSTKASKKGVISYNPLHGIASMKNHVTSNHSVLFEIYKGQVVEGDEQNPIKELQKSKKRKGPAPTDISNFFGDKKSYGKNDVAQVQFIEDLVLYVAKSYKPLASVEDVWFRRMILQQNGRVVFPNRKQLVEHHLPAMLEKTMGMYVLPKLAQASTVSLTFDLWMSRAGFDTFTLIINFLDSTWVPCHVCVGIFEAPKTDGKALADLIKPLLEKFKLTKKVLAYVKDEGSNLITMATTLESVVSCDSLDVDNPYGVACYGHIMSKACQYATDDKKVCKDMSQISLSKTQSALQSTITWTKKSGKGRQEWMDSCIAVGLRPRKLKTPVKTRFASKVVLYEETLRYRVAIIECYSKQSIALQAQVPSGATWAIAQAVVDVLNPVVTICVLNQTRGYWLLLDALHSALSLYMRLKADNERRFGQLPRLEVGEFEYELLLLHCKMADEVITVLKPFLTFCQSFDAKQGNNMLALMLDPRFKNLQIVSKYLGGSNRAMPIITQYDDCVLMPMLMSVKALLRPEDSQSTPMETESEDQYRLFGPSTSSFDASLSSCKSELGLFWQVRVAQDIAPLSWWKDNEVRFPIVGFLAKQILGIPGSQIECERIFSMAGVMTSLRRSRLGVDNLDKLVMIAENWPSVHALASGSLINDFYDVEEEVLDGVEDELEREGLFEDEVVGSAFGYAIICFGLSWFDLLLHIYLAALKDKKDNGYLQNYIIA